MNRKETIIKCINKPKFIDTQLHQNIQQNKLIFNLFFRIINYLWLLLIIKNVIIFWQ
jgi:hypothetical protein